MTPTEALLAELRLLRAMGEGGRAAAARALKLARLGLAAEHPGPAATATGTAAPTPSTEFDPMKLLANELDAGIVVRGGKSIYATKARGTPSPEADARLEAWTGETPRRHSDAGGPKPDARPQVAKPGRLVGTLTGKLGGFASDREDER